MPRFKRLKSVFFVDTMFATKYNSTKVNKCFQVFASDKCYVDVYYMKYQDEFETIFHWLCKEVGTPIDLILCGFSYYKIRKDELAFSILYHNIGMRVCMRHSFIWLFGFFGKF